MQFLISIGQISRLVNPDRGVLDLSIPLGIFRVSRLMYSDAYTNPVLSCFLLKTTDEDAFKSLFGESDCLFWGGSDVVRCLWEEESLL